MNMKFMEFDFSQELKYMKLIVKTRKEGKSKRIVYLQIS